MSKTAKKTQPKQLKPTVANLNWKGNPIKQVTYKGKFSKKEVQQLANKVKQHLKQNEKLMVTLNYGPQIGPKSSKWATRQSHAVELYNANDYNDNVIVPNTFYKINFYVQKGPATKGGDSENNNCLYNCLREVIPMSDLPWKIPIDLKKFVGCKENAKIDFNQLGNIENRLGKKYAIHLTGDHIHTSLNNDAIYNINLKIYNGHYTLANKSAYLKQKGIVSTEKQIAIYDYDDENNNIKVYNGTKFLRITHEQLKQHQKIPALAPYLYVINEKGSKMKDTYNNFIKLADELKKETDGQINLYKTGNLRRTALDLFYKFHKTLEIEEIQQEEALWIQKSTIRPIIFAKKFEGKGYLYDFKSMYPFIQSNPKMLFLIKKGEFFNISNEEFQQKEYLQYGIYKVEITTIQDNKYNKIFKFNKSNNYYTHFDINQARKYGG